MSTRGAIGFIIDGVTKVTYNHSDSYPSWLGREILKFIMGADLEEVRAQAKVLVLVDENSKPTLAQIKALRKFCDTSVGNQKMDDWYCLLRDTQGDLAKILACGHMIEGESFLHDSLFCEWAYIINLDTNTLEVYRGFNHEPKAPGRYAALGNSEHDDPYYGVRLISEHPLAELQGIPSRFNRKREALSEKITEGWERVADDIYEAHERVQKEKKELAAQGLQEIRPA